MFGERFSDPVIFAVVSANEDDKVVTCSVVGVEEIRDKAQEAETAGEDEQLVFGAKVVEDVLLELEGEGKANGRIR